MLSIDFIWRCDLDSSDTCTSLDFILVNGVHVTSRRSPVYFSRPNS